MKNLEINFSGLIELHLDYSQTAEQLIVFNKYLSTECTNMFFDFPILKEKSEKKTKIRTVLYDFKQEMSTDEIILEMKKNNHRPANIKELVILGVTRPDLQAQFLIVALGSIRKNYFGVNFAPVLGTQGKKRIIDSLKTDDNWCSGFRFLAILSE